MTPPVTLRHVGMRYRRRAAAGEDAYAVFDDINLELHRGERLGVVGRNGELGCLGAGLSPRF